jgi:hypothetical protein
VRTRVEDGVSILGACKDRLRSNDVEDAKVGVRCGEECDVSSYEKHSAETLEEAKQQEKGQRTARCFSPIYMGHTLTLSFFNVRAGRLHIGCYLSQRKRIFGSRIVISRVCKHLDTLNSLLLSFPSASPKVSRTQATQGDRGEHNDIQRFGRSALREAELQPVTTLAPVIRGNLERRS